MKIALEKINESKEIVILAQKAKLPIFTGTISGKYDSKDTSTATSSSTSETFTDSYKVVLKQNLYSFGIKDLEVERSKILFDNEIIKFKKSIQDLILEAINGYLTVINFEKSLEENKKNYDSVSKALEETKTRYNLGSATLYDLQNSEAAFASATTNLFAAEQNILISKISFERIVGLKPINLEDVLNINSEINISSIIDESLKNNLDLNLISNEIINNEILILKEKKSKRPSLDLTGTASYSDGGRIDQGSEITSGSLDLTLTIPIFNKGIENSNIKKYNSKLLQSEIQLEDFKGDLLINISNTFKDFKISESKMNSNKIIIKSINTSLDSLNAEFEIGTKTISDIVEEEGKLLEANVNFLDSKKDYLLNYFKLKSLDGTLINLFEDYLPNIN